MMPAELRSDCRDVAAIDTQRRDGDAECDGDVVVVVETGTQMRFVGNMHTTLCRY